MEKQNFLFTGLRISVIIAPVNRQFASAEGRETHYPNAPRDTSGIAKAGNLTPAARPFVPSISLLA